MRTLDLKEAAAFLKMTPEGLRRKVANGDIPGAKPGKRWCFREDDLAEYLRSLYSSAAKTSWGVVETIRRTTTWHSAKEETSGGLESVTMEKEYNKALGLPTR
ncbi:MAG: helix-turn-helix domain-containing protein [Gammaproteobacteria bacterium]|nr:helix-turn-helix domain-containing protein [Gammaproteobacteria bacterium]